LSQNASAKSKPKRGNAAERELETFIDRFDPEIAATARAALAKMRKRLPNTFQLVYDNYNALVVGFCPTMRPSSVIFSIAIYPRSAALCFFCGGALYDPKKLLEGNGKISRHIKLESADMLELPAVKALMTQALALAAEQPDETQPGEIVIKSVSPKQRPRRPSVPVPAKKGREGEKRASAKWPPVRGRTKGAG
jgi:hypothetical protein